MNKRIKKKKKLIISPKETWCLDVTISRFIAPRLKLFKKIKSGYPATLSAETWDEYLDAMIFSFETLSQIDEVENKIWLNDDLMQIEKKTQQEKLNKQVQYGLNLFAEYFRDLWW